MTPRRQLTDPGTGAPAQRGRRAAILQTLRDTDSPVSVADVAERVGVHLNTARFHLDALVAEGTAARGTVPRSEPGRPKVVYSAVADEGPDGSRSFRLLSDILLCLLYTSPGAPTSPTHPPPPSASAPRRGNANWWRCWRTWAS